MIGDALTNWVIYKNPTDFPRAVDHDTYVARKWLVNDHGIRPTQEFFREMALEPLRLRFESQGFVCIGRTPSDDPCIVEVWL